MKKIGSLRELSAPEHFVVIVVVLKTQSALGITLDVNSMAVILSPPPLPIPPLLTDGQTRKKQAHGWISIRPGWRKEEKIGKTRLTYNCAHLRSTKESLTIRVKIFWLNIFWVKIFLS